MNRISNNRIKENVAREIIVFWSLIFIIIVFSGSIFLFEFYIKRGLNEKQKILAMIESKNKSIPKNELIQLYEYCSPHFVEYYVADGKDYCIPKEVEKDFLLNFTFTEKYTDKEDLFNIRTSKYVIVDDHKITFEDISDLGKKIKEKYTVYSEETNESIGTKILNNYSPVNDTIIDFSFVDFDEFKSNLKNEMYREELSKHKIFKKYPNIMDVILSGIKYPFDSTLAELQNEKKRVSSEINQLNMTKIQIEKNYRTKILDYSKFLFIFVYSVRILFFSISWSNKALRNIND